MSGTTLQPDDARRRFEREMTTLLTDRAGVLLLLGAIAFPLPMFNDVRLFPDRWPQMLLLRLVGTLVCALGMAVVKSPLGLRYPRQIVLALALVLTLIQTFLHPMEAGGLGTFYLSGHLMVLIGTLAMLPLPAGWALAISLVVQAGFLLPIVLFARRIDIAEFSMENSVLVISWTFLSIASHVSYKTSYREFLLRDKLHAARDRSRDYG